VAHACPTAESDTRNAPTRLWTKGAIRLCTFTASLQCGMKIQAALIAGHAEPAFNLEEFLVRQ
jgi:hypothetical protein